MALDDKEAGQPLSRGEHGGRWVTWMAGSPRTVCWGLLALSAIALGAVFWPQRLVALFTFVALSFYSVLPIIIAGLALSCWMNASGLSQLAARAFRGHPVKTITLAAGIGAITPVCGIAALPMMTGLLAAGVPLAPVMAFWVSSPVTDPGMFAATWAILGPGFAIGKSIAAFGIGLIAGVVTSLLTPWPMIGAPLRAPLRNGALLAQGCCGGPETDDIVLLFWRDPARWRMFRSEFLSMTRLVLLCLLIAFAAEFLLRDLVPPATLATQLMAKADYAIPLAVLLGAPLYVDGFAALPLARGLLDLGLPAGAIMAFLVAGSAVSVWGIFAVLPVLRLPVLTLLAALAIVGSAASGYTFQWAMAMEGARPAATGGAAP